MEKGVHNIECKNFMEVKWRNSGVVVSTCRVETGDGGGKVRHTVLDFDVGPGTPHRESRSSVQTV